MDSVYTLYMIGVTYPSHGSRPTPDAIADAIRTAVAQGVYRPGQRLLQEELADRFGVSRIPLREAMRTLVAEGLVVSDSSGTYVNSLDLARIDEIYDLRRLVEPSFAGPVVNHSSRADTARFAEMAERMDERDRIGSDEWSRINFAFHLDMYRLANLPLRYEVMSRLYHQLEPYSRYYVHATSAIARVQCEHHAMVDSLREGDAEKLAEQIIAHIDGGQDGLRRAWATMPSVTTAARSLEELR
jgi:DNA-binding GntR family transcriptional regulator